MTPMIPHLGRIGQGEMLLKPSPTWEGREVEGVVYLVEMGRDCIRLHRKGKEGSVRDVSDISLGQVL